MPGKVQPCSRARTGTRCFRQSAKEASESAVRAAGVASMSPTNRSGKRRKRSNRRVELDRRDAACVAGARDLSRARGRLLDRAEEARGLQSRNVTTDPFGAL